MRFFGFIPVLLEKLLLRWGFIRVARFQGRTPTEFTDRDRVRVMLIKNLLHRLPPTSHGEQGLAALAQAIISDIEIQPSASMFSILSGDIFSARKVNYWLGAGVACQWEMELKVLAWNLNVNVYDQPGERDRTPEFLGLEAIIANLQRAIPRANLDLGRLKNIRDALVHSNFHQLRLVTQPGLRAPVARTLTGNVTRMHFADLGIQRLSEIRGARDAAAEGPYAWFVDAGTSALFEVAVTELKDGILDIIALQWLKALSFGETHDAYASFVRGERIEGAAATRFIDLRGPSITQMTPTQMLERINSAIR